MNRIRRRRAALLAALSVVAVVGASAPPASAHFHSGYQFFTFPNVSGSPTASDALVTGPRGLGVPDIDLNFLEIHYAPGHTFVPFGSPLPGEMVGVYDQKGTDPDIGPCMLGVSQEWAIVWDSPFVGPAPPLGPGETWVAELQLMTAGAPLSPTPVYLDIVFDPGGVATPGSLAEPRGFAGVPHYELKTPVPFPFAGHCLGGNLEFEVSLFSRGPQSDEVIQINPPAKGTYKSYVDVGLPNRHRFRDRYEVAL